MIYLLIKRGIKYDYFYKQLIYTTIVNTKYKFFIYFLILNIYTSIINVTLVD